MPKTVAEILRAAANHLRRTGHCKGGYARTTSPTSPCCAIGAINAVVNGTPLNVAQSLGRTEAIRVLAETIIEAPLAAGTRPSAVVSSWNDRGTQTAADVISTLEWAASKWAHTQTRQ